MVVIVTISHHQFFDPKRAGCNFYIFTIAGQLIGTLTVDLDGREFGRNLHDVANKAAEGLLDLRICGPLI